VSGTVESNKEILVYVRWLDGYLEKFVAIEVRFGSNLLWIRNKSGQNRHIPLISVRWYSVYPESHESSMTAETTDLRGAER
jgi:hypothetical protein